MRPLERSHELWKRAERVIPLGTQTLSKSPTQFVRGISPIYLERGRGAHVWDVDGNRYLDFPMALGPVILGYCDPGVDAAIKAQIDAGITFTLMHPLEVEVAEQIVDLVPGTEAVRFGKTGSDAVSAAVRAARALTGRDQVIVTGYHGWHDWYVGSTSRNRGVPAAVSRLVTSVPFNDPEALRSALRTGGRPVAAVVVEPAGAEVPEPGYLALVAEQTRECGALLIFDEVITGFRLAPGGARQRYGVEPDLSCFGKALGNGMPISAVAGRWSIMKVFEDVFFSGTHGGEALSLAAASAVLDRIATTPVLADIRSLGTVLLDGMTRAVASRGVDGLVKVGGEPERAVVSFAGPDPLVTKTWVQQVLIEHGILFNGSMFICARHQPEDIDHTLVAFGEALEGISRFEDLRAQLKGPPAEPVFRVP